MRTCNKCKIEKESEIFSKDRSHKDGLKSICKTCDNARAMLYLANPEKIKAAKVRSDAHYKANREKILFAQAIYNRIHHEKKKAYRANYNKLNSDKRNADAAKRRATKVNATPSWLTKEQHLENKEFYVLAQELQWLSNEKLHVDHIVPLRGYNVCGLHVPWNLQILPESMNLSKHNKFEYIKKETL
jgi:hypothetical protein